VAQGAIAVEYGIVAECGGPLSCATCHVLVASSWIDGTRVPKDFEVVTPSKNRWSRYDAGVQHGRHAELPEVGHLAPAKAPAAVAHLIIQHKLIRNINQSLAFSFLSDIDRGS
jgi:hypothetical protein